MFYSSTHKSEIPHTRSASVDVRTLNRVKDKIFFPLEDALIVCFSLRTDGRSLRGKGEAVGGSSGQVKETLCWSCFDFIFSPSLPCFRSIPSSSLSALTFTFLFLFFPSEGWVMGWTWFPEAEYNWPFRRCSPQSHWDSCLWQIVPELTPAYINNVQAFSFVSVSVFSAFSSWGKTRKGKKRETEELQTILIHWGCTWVW